MKILHIIDSGNLYGAEVMLLNLIEEQRRNGLKTVLCNIGMNIKIGNSIDEEAIKRGIYVLNIKFKRGFDIKNAVELLKEALRIKIDIIHSHSYKSDIIFGLIPKFFRKIPMITTLHGLTDTFSFNKLNLYDTIACLLYRNIDALILVDKSMLENKKIKYYRYCNVYVIENGIQEIGGNEINRKLDLKIELCNKNKIVIGSIGRLDYEKGYHVLIEAFNVLKKEGIFMKLIIIGDGPERENLNKLIMKYKLMDNICIPGYKQNAKNYLRLFDIFILPSFREGLPITILEAMQAGVPIIATSVGGIPEMLQHGKAGVIIKSNNVQILVEAIKKLLNNDELKNNMVSVARNVVKERYSSDVMVKKYMNIYENVLKKYNI